MWVLSSVGHDVGTETQVGMQPGDQGIPSNMQSRCSSQLPGQVEATEVEVKHQAGDAVPSIVSGKGMCTRRQDDIGTASEAVDLMQSRQQWLTAEEGGPSAAHLERSSHTERTMPSQMRFQAGELIGEYILYRF